MVNQILDQYTYLPITNVERWRLRNPDKVKNYRENNRKTINDNHKRWYENNKESALKDQRDRRKKIRQEAITILGGKCSNPFNLNHGDFLIDERCLTIDHVNNGGRQDRKRFRSVEKFYKFVIEQVKKGSKDYQCLCSNCNQIKEIERRGIEG